MSAGFASHSLYCSKSAPILFDLLIIPANAPGVNFAWALIMNFHDQSRYCHAERSEASVCPSRQTLRGVYTERSECAQGDKLFPLLLVNIHNEVYF
jgi:hypothetical protein